MTVRSVDIGWLVDWFQAECDGDWEHSFGVSLTTLDNPGWAIKIPLSETEAEGREFEIRDDESARWFHVWSDGQRLQGACGVDALPELLDSCRTFLAPNLAS